MSWVCTTEPALRSNPADFDVVGDDLGRRAADIDPMADELAALARSGWSGIDGQFADGLQYLSHTAAAQIRGVAGAADVGGRAFDEASEQLDGLRRQSDELLAEAADAHRRLEQASADAEAAQRNVTSWKWRRDHAETADEHDRAGRNFWYHVGVREEHERAARLAQLQLDNHQRAFEQLRDAEDDIHERLGSDLRSIDLDPSPPSSAPHAVVPSLESLLDLFDAAMVGYAGLGRGYGWNLRQAIERGRQHLAAAAGIDLDERDRSINIAGLLRRATELGPEGIADELNAALESGHPWQLQRIAELLNAVFAHGSDDDIVPLLDQIDDYSHIIFALAFDDSATGNDTLLQMLLGMGEMPIFLGFSLEQSEAMIERFPEWAAGDQSVDEFVRQRLFEQILASPGGFLRLDKWLAGDLGLVSPYQSPELGAALLQHFIDNPDSVAKVAFDGSQKTQDYIELINNMDPTADEWTALTVAWARDFDVQRALAANDDTFDLEVWNQFGSFVGSFQKQISEAGGPGYDPTKFAEYVIRLGIKEFPGGQFADAAWSGVKALIGGYQADTTYQLLAEEDRLDLDRRALATALISQVDPTFAADLEAELETIDASNDAERLRILLSNGYEGDLSFGTRIVQLAGAIEDGVEDVLGT